jgi:hypothetical protein
MVMTVHEKAKILDAIIANHGAIIALHEKAKYVCGCDPDVGVYCESCSERDLFKQLLDVMRLIEPPKKKAARQMPVLPPAPQNILIREGSDKVERAR